jgi:hypothetical protein
LKPHRVEYWLNSNPDDPERFKEEVVEICDLYKEAQQLQEEGTHLLSTDEKTGIQALERAAESLPMKPGLVEKIEYQYLRHGTQCLIANFEVATGKVIAATVGASRTQEDFVSHIEQTIATHREAKWIFITDQLNTHQSEGLVRLVARECVIEGELGEKGKSGVIKTMPSRAEFLKDKNGSFVSSVKTTIYGGIESRQI